jgi:hypothetical protein
MYRVITRITFVIAVAVTGASAITWHVFPSETNLKLHSALAHSTSNLVDVIANLQPGDTVFIRNGTHASYSSTIYFDKSGTPDAPIHLLAYPGETPVFDFSGNDGPGMVLSGMYADYVGQTFQNAADNGLRITGSNNTITRCNFIGNGDSGLQIESANNTITNCDSYYNRDASEGNADGFAPKLNVGSGNKFIGCRAWQNSDDGWDGYLKSSRDVSQSLENCWAIKNGYRKDGTAGQGNGNGFKPGSDQGTQNWTMKNCLAYGNLQKGFDQNHNLGSVTMYNCTSVDNGKNNFTEYEQPASGKTATIKNCLAAQTKSSFAAQNNVGTFVVQSNNSWSGGFTIDATDFESIDPGTQLTAARKSDGSLPDITFMRLKQGSDLVDAGVNVGIAYKGKAPDIGAFESEYTSPIAAAPVKPKPGIAWDLYSSGDFLSFAIYAPARAKATLTLRDLSGRQTLKCTDISLVKGSNSRAIPARGLKPGVYLCSLEFSGMAVSKKVAKKI